MKWQNSAFYVTLFSTFIHKIYVASINIYFEIERFNQTDIYNRNCITKLIHSLFSNNDSITFILRNNQYLEYLTEIHNKKLILDPFSPTKLKYITYAVVIYLENTAVEIFIKKFKNLSTFSQKKCTTSRYIVVLKSEYIIASVFKSFWYEDLMKVIIVHEENVYVANPYWKENKCGKSVTKYSSQNCEEQIQFFEQPQTFTGCDLTAGILNNMFDLPQIGKDPYSKSPGMYIHPIRFFQNILGFNVNYSSEDYKGEYVLKGVTDLQEARVNERHIDLIAISLFNHHIYNAFDVSEIFYIDDYLWAMNKRPQINPLTVLFSIFHWETWFCIFLAFIIVTVIWKAFRNFMNPSRYTSWAQCLQEVFPMSIGIVIPLNPNTSAHRLLMMAYLIYSFYTVIYFQGNLSSVLTLRRDLPAFRSMEELIDSDIIPVAMNFLVKELRALDFPTAVKLGRKLENRPGNTSASRLLNVIASNKSVASIIMRSALSMYVSYNYKLDVIGTQFLPSFYTVYGLRKGHHLLPALDRILRRVRESGLSEKWLSDVREQYFTDPKERSSILLTLDHLKIAFVLLFGGLFLGVVAFSLECTVFVFLSLKEIKNI